MEEGREKGGREGGEGGRDGVVKRRNKYATQLFNETKSIQTTINHRVN